MNTAKLKSFAPALRIQLMEAVERKLDYALSADTPDLRQAASQVSELRKKAEDNRDQLIEQVAYTWFNRLAALRFLDAHDWHPFKARIVVPATEDETQPEVLKLMRTGSLPEKLAEHTDLARLNQILDGRIPSANPQREVYRSLVLAACRFYHTALPFLFEEIDDETELLLPDDLLTPASIAEGFRTEISDEDCADVEIIGWLYQFYISEKKDQVIGKVVKSEDIPAATQLFTPNWIVKYMVQNSLGAQWLATYPQSPLKGQMEYYIEPAEQADEVKAQLAAITPSQLNPEDLTLIDPASGSGHILVEAYELFKAIYLERGYRQRDVPQLILEKNLFGLDIDERAAQLTGFALMMKGRADDRRLFERGVKLNVMALVDSGGREDDQWSALIDQLPELAPSHSSLATEINELVDLFEHATTFGSLIQVPEELTAKLPVLKQLSEATSHDLFVSEALKRLGPLVQQAEMLAAQYDAVVANPPYMGARYYSPVLKKFVTDVFEAGKADLYGAFTLRNIQLARESGHVGMITIPNWMFLSSFEQFRDGIFENAPIKTLVHNGRGVWGSDFGSCSYVLQCAADQRMCGRFLRLFDIPGSVSSNEELERRFHVNSRFSTSNAEFRRIPGSPVAYWVSEHVREAFGAYPSLDTVATPSNGVQTGDNDRFLRFWTEIDCQKIARAWVPYNKGGKFRKWYGNIEHVVFWESDGLAIKSQKNSCYRGEEHYRSAGVTWSDVTSGRLSARYMPEGCIFDAAGPTAFFEDSRFLHATLCLLNAPEVNQWSKILNPTVHFQTGDFRKLVLAPDLVCRETVSSVESLIANTTADWDAYERSWDFQSLPLLTVSSDPTLTLESSYTAWITQNRDTIAEMKRLEEENNRLFIDAYGLADELTPDVPIEQITLTVNPAYRYGKKVASDQWSVASGFPKELEDRFRADTMEELISYAIGCMMGRYSLDAPGLILADSRPTQAEHMAAYLQKIGKPKEELTFVPDEDGIIPVLDDEWFEDDIVSRLRAFLRATFGDDSLEENLRFIEDSLGKKLRKYLVNDFYKTHLQTYKKRPIYWLFSSPKKSFQALVYLHRYTRDTANTVLNKYLREYLHKLRARIEHLEFQDASGNLSAKEKKEIDKLRKTLHECEEWEREVLLPLAQQRLEIDLDDGVKQNYPKFGKALAKVPGLS